MNVLSILAVLFFGFFMLNNFAIAGAPLQKGAAPPQKPPAASAPRPMVQPRPSAGLSAGPKMNFQAGRAGNFGRPATSILRPSVGFSAPVRQQQFQTQPIPYSMAFSSPFNRNWQRPITQPRAEYKTHSLPNSERAWRGLTEKTSVPAPTLNNGHANNGQLVRNERLATNPTSKKTRSDAQVQQTALPTRSWNNQQNSIAPKTGLNEQKRSQHFFTTANPTFDSGAWHDNNGQLTKSYEIPTVTLPERIWGDQPKTTEQKKEDLVREIGYLKMAQGESFKPEKYAKYSLNELERKYKDEKKDYKKIQDHRESQTKREAIKYDIEMAQRQLGIPFDEKKYKDLSKHELAQAASGYMKQVEVKIERDEQERRRKYDARSTPIKVEERSWGGISPHTLEFLNNQKNRQSQTTDRAESYLPASEPKKYEISDLKLTNEAETKSTTKKDTGGKFTYNLTPKKDPIIITVPGLAFNEFLPDGTEFLKTIGIKKENDNYLYEAVKNSLASTNGKSKVINFQWDRDPGHSREYVNQLKGYILGSYGQAKEKGQDLNIISHSWGTVLAYSALKELEKENNVKVKNLVTLGSPLNYANIKEKNLFKPGFPLNKTIENNPIGIIGKALFSTKETLSEGLPPGLLLNYTPKPKNVSNWTNYWANGDVLSGSVRYADNDIEIDPQNRNKIITNVLTTNKYHRQFFEDEKLLGEAIGTFFH